MHLCWLWCLGAAAGPGRASRRRAERSSRRGRRAGGPTPPGTNTQTSKRTQAPQTTSDTPNGQLAARRTASGQLAARASIRRAERSSRRGRRAGGPPPPGTNTQTSKRTQAPRTASRQLAARTPSGRAERAGRVGGPSGRAAATRHQHAEHAHTTRPGPAAPNSAEDPGLVKQSDQAVHHEGGECFERGLDLALGQRGERCDSVVGPGAREFARLIEHVVGAQAFHDRGEGLVGG